MVGLLDRAGRELTFAGVTVLRFDDRGKVVEHRYYDNHVERRQPPCAGLVKHRFAVGNATPPAW